MTIELDAHELAALVVGALTLIGLLLGTLAMAARALRTATEANGKLTETLIKMNDELQDSVKDRRVAEEERRALQREIDGLKVQAQAAAMKYESLLKQHGELRADSEKANTQLLQELIKVKGQLKQAADRIAELERDVKTRDVQIERLTDRIAELEKSGKEKDNRITDLRTALTQSEQDKQELADEIKALQRLMNGKADKPGAVKSEPEAAPETPEAPDADKPQEA